MLIDGIGIAGYRSFGSAVQRIGPFKKLNIFIGQNNSGKSNILRFLTKHYPEIIKATRGEKADFSFTPLDQPRVNASGMLRIEIGLHLSDRLLPDTLEAFDKRINGHGRRILEAILRSPTVSRDSELAWFPFESPWPNSAPTFKMSQSFFEELAALENIRQQDWYELWRQLTGHGRGDLLNHVVPQTIQQIVPVGREALGSKTAIVSAIRKIGTASEASTDSEEIAGTGIVEQLQRLQNPDHDQQDLKNDFKTINEFLRYVTGNCSATLEIPHNRERILVHMDGTTLPLSSLGMGIHEVVILASAATVTHDSLFCIEEPELHMHPVLQRKLVKYLQDNTDNQYFIATHSAHILDTADAAVFHVRLENGSTTVDPVYTASERSLVCADLGYRASDLLQANCIIWVEGPSDRIYLRHWIRALDDSLIEGLHYSIMFYGGRLLSHLTADDPEVDEFISLRRLNRYISILIDSDRRAKGKKMGSYDTKKRIIDEFDKGPGFAWVTKGREIENYIPEDLLESAVRAVQPSAVRLGDTGQYARILHYINRKGELKKDTDKVKVARFVTGHPAQLDVLDLKKQVSDLVTFIRAANGLDE